MRLLWKSCRSLASAALLTIGVTTSCYATYTSDWTTVSGDTFDGATNWNNADYIRSETTYDAACGCSSSVIEDYRLGNDGYMYVAVVQDGVLTGLYRYPYEYNPGPNDPPDPFGDIGNPGPFDPPGGTNWASDNGGYTGITAMPEPETYAMMLVGLGAIGLLARRRRK